MASLGSSDSSGEVVEIKLKRPSPQPEAVRCPAPSRPSAKKGPRRVQFQPFGPEIGASGTDSGFCRPPGTSSLVPSVALPQLGAHGAAPKRFGRPPTLLARAPKPTSNGLPSDPSAPGRMLPDGRHGALLPLVALRGGVPAALVPPAFAAVPPKKVVRLVDRSNLAREKRSAKADPAPKRPVAPGYSAPAARPAATRPVPSGLREPPRQSWWARHDKPFGARTPPVPPVPVSDRRSRLRPEPPRLRPNQRAGNCSRTKPCVSL